MAEADAESYASRKECFLEVSGTSGFPETKASTPATVHLILDDTEIREQHFLQNKTAASKKRPFYVVQADRLQCLNGAYLYEASSDLARLLLDRPVDVQLSPLNIVREARTDERLRNVLTRIGQRKFSDLVRKNDGTQVQFYGNACRRKPSKNEPRSQLPGVLSKSTRWKLGSFFEGSGGQASSSSSGSID